MSSNSSSATSTSNAIPSSTSPASTAAPHSSSSLPIPAIVVPLAALSVLLIALLLYSNQRKLRNGNNASRNLHRNSTSSASNQPRPSILDKVWKAIKNNFAVQYSAPQSGTTNSASANATAAATPRRGRRDRLRRTESGASVKTVPEYKFDPAEDELVLYKAATRNSLQDSNSVLNLTRLDSRFSGIQDSRIDLSGEEGEDLDQAENRNQNVDRRVSVRLTQGEAGRSSVALLDSNGDANLNSNSNDTPNISQEDRVERNSSVVGRMRNSIRRSMGLNTNSGVDDEEALRENDVGNQMVELQHGRGTTASTQGGSNIDRVARTASGISNASHSSRGPAPEYDSIGDLDPARDSLDTIPDGNNSTPSISVSNADGANRNGHGRNHSNATLLGLRSIFGRNPNNNQSSSANGGHRRFESTSALPGTSPNHSRNGSNVSSFNQATTSRSSLSLARIHSSLSSSGNNQSTTSLNQSQSTPPRTSTSNISRPLPESLIRSKFDIPKAGISSQQMTFLGSVENLGKYGIPTDEDGNTELPPAFESGEERRREEEMERERQRIGNRGLAPLLTNAEIYNRSMSNENGDVTTLPLPGTNKLKASGNENETQDRSGEESGTPLAETQVNSSAGSNDNDTSNENENASVNAIVNNDNAEPQEQSSSIETISDESNRTQNL